MKKMILLASALGLGFVLNACGGSSSDSLPISSASVSQNLDGSVLTFKWTPRNNAIEVMVNNGDSTMKNGNSLTVEKITADETDANSVLGSMAQSYEEAKINRNKDGNIASIDFNAKGKEQTVTCKLDTKKNTATTIHYDCMNNKDINSKLVIPYGIGSEMEIPKKESKIVNLEATSAFSKIRHIDTTVTYHKKIATLTNYNSKSGWTITPVK